MRGKRGAIRLLYIPALLYLLSGCEGRPELHVPTEFTQSPLKDDLEVSLPGVAFVTAGENDLFQLCGSDGLGCRQLVFGSHGLEGSLSEAMDFMFREVKVTSILLGIDSRYAELSSSDSIRFEEAAVTVMVQTPMENIDSFVQAVTDEISILRDGDDRWGAILVMGRAGPAVLRRLGLTSAASGDGGAVIMELFLPASGERLVQAGYPLVGAIGYDLERAEALFDANPQSDEPIHVPMRLFRY